MRFLNIDRECRVKVGIRKVIRLSDFDGLVVMESQIGFLSFDKTDHFLKDQYRW